MKFWTTYLPIDILGWEMDNFLRHAHKFCLDIVPQYYTRILLCMGMLGHPMYWCVSSARPTAIFETFVAPKRFGQPTGVCIVSQEAEDAWIWRQIGRIPSLLLVAVLVKLQCFHSKAVLCMQSIILQSNAMSSPRFFYTRKLSRKQR